MKLISSSTGLELPDVFPKKLNDGFEIRNARLPEHDGQIECVAETKDGATDSVKYFLRFQGLKMKLYQIDSIFSVRNCTISNIKHAQVHHSILSISFSFLAE